MRVQAPCATRPPSRPAPVRATSTDVGKTLPSVTAVAQMIGPFGFDSNATQIFNASWPPHAKFIMRRR